MNRVVIKEPRRYIDKYAARVVIKQCSKCKEFKDLGSFKATAKSAIQVHSQCKKCQNETRNIVRNRNPELTRQKDYEAHLKYNYGLTSLERKALAEKQKNSCAICKKIKRLVIDHDHKTDKIRGLLCNDCNLLLGHAKDAIHVLQEAIRYIRFNRK
jgi:arginine decarboxylase-like protein